MALDLYKAPVNNTGIDPLQGFDFQVWAQDSASGSVAFFGAFQSLTLSIRDATETYLELGQRIPIYLNGEIQIAWVLEQGLVDMTSVVLRTFGLRRIARDQIISRGPRFQIAFDAGAYDLEQTFTDDGQIYRLGAKDLSPFRDAELGRPSAGPSVEPYLRTPHVVGRYELMRCKVDSVSLGIMPGRRVAAVRWEGVSEGITWVPETVQQFKSNLSNPNAERQLSTVPTGDVFGLSSLSNVGTGPGNSFSSGSSRV